MSRAFRLSSEVELQAIQQRIAGHKPTQLQPQTKPPTPNKHGAIPTMRGELRFDSKREAEIWDGLCARFLCGDVSYLQRQVTFPFHVSGVKVGSYRCDFMYRTTDGVWHIADAKSSHTRKLPGFARSRQLMVACYGIVIEEM